MQLVSRERTGVSSIHWAGGLERKKDDIRRNRTGKPTNDSCALLVEDLVRLSLHQRNDTKTYPQQPTTHILTSGERDERGGYRNAGKKQHLGCSTVVARRMVWWDTLRVLRTRDQKFAPFLGCVEYILITTTAIRFFDFCKKRRACQRTHVRAPSGDGYSHIYPRGCSLQEITRS